MFFLKKYKKYFIVLIGSISVCTQAVAQGSSVFEESIRSKYCNSCIAGYKFDLKEHDRDDMNRGYVLRNLSVHADQDKYINLFEAFPSDVPFRPPRTTSKPKIPGTQTAIVAGKKGEEIWTDQYGRVKVQFHWDQEGKRDENSSCWVRVTQTWAGKGWGTLFIPRIGTEVIVSFLEGDPDRPLITGTVYNALTVPYSLPGSKNISTMKTISTLKGKAGNEIRFDDTKNKEEFFTHAQKDKNEVVENNKSVSIGKNLIETVKGSVTNMVMGFFMKTVIGNSTKMIQGNCQKAVLLNELTAITGNSDKKIGGNCTLKVGGDLTIEADGEIIIKGSKIHLNP